jgi:hypothetical protein
MECRYPAIEKDIPRTNCTFKKGTTMKKIILILASMATLFINEQISSAQIAKNLDYAKHAAEIRKKVWEWQIPEFDRRDIPDEYADASSVILATHNEIVAKSRKKIRFTTETISANNELYYINTVRQLVKINDQSALDEYSEISLQQLRKRSGRAIDNTMLTTAGVRIIKPDGSIREVDMDEAVMTKNEKNDIHTKIAIPGLQTGDMIDYFIRIEEQMDDKNIDPLLFVFGTDVPILSYSIHCEIGNRFTVEYRAMNGAPDFAQTTNADKDFVLDIRMENITAMPVDLWMSPIRQIPILRLHILDNNRTNKPKTSRPPGTIHPNIDPQLIIAETCEYINWQISRYNSPAMVPYYSKINKLVKKYKRTHSANPDSIAQFVYYAMRHYIFNSVSKENIVVDNRRNFRTINNVLFMVAYERMLHQLNIPCKYFYLTSRYEPPLDQILSVFDVTIAVSTMTINPMIVCAEGAFTPAGYIPDRFTGQQVQVASFKNEGGRAGEMKIRPRGGMVDIPAPEASANIVYDKLLVKMNMEQPDELLLSRTTTAKGDMKGFQQLLLLYEEYEWEERKALGIKDNIISELNANIKTRPLASEYLHAFEEARKAQKEQFETEIFYRFEVKPKEVTNHQVISNGTMHRQPNLMYSADFVVDSWVKKAGANYLVDVGKLIGAQLVLTPQQRIRTMDIYMPCARTFEQDIEIEIPDGYAVEGLENLNREIRNSCGEFTAAVRQEGDRVYMKVSKVFLREFEPVEQWQSLLEIIDAAGEWREQTLMLRKF